MESARLGGRASEGGDVQEGGDDGAGAGGGVGGGHGARGLWGGAQRGEKVVWRAWVDGMGEEREGTEEIGEGGLHLPVEGNGRKYGGEA